MNYIKTAILLAALTALLLGVGQLLGGQQGLIIALVFALIMNVGAYWFSDKIVLKMYKAQPITPESAPDLYNLVKGLAQKDGLPMPALYIVDEAAPNAFATGRNPQHAAMAFTTGILQRLSKEELTGVIAHELSHIKNRDTLIMTITATIAGAISALASIAQWGMLTGNRGNSEHHNGGSILATLALIILAPIAAALIQLAVSRSREYSADYSGAKLCGQPLWLAKALGQLEKASKQQPMISAERHPATAHMFIVNPLSAKGIAALFATHPPLEDRIQRLKEMAGGMRSE